MNFNDYKNLIQNTRSTRRYKQNITINPKELEEVIDITRIVASPKNMQPLKYLTVTSKQFVDKISQSATWASKLPQWDQKEDERPSAYIIILNDTSLDGVPMIDCGITLQTIMLGLKTKGYDSCPLASVNKDLIKELFNLEDNLQPMVGLSIGISDENITLTDIEECNDYFRNEKEEHFVPKRELKDVLIKNF